MGRPLAAGLRPTCPASAVRGHGCARSSTTSGTPSTRRACGCAPSTGPRSTRWSPGPADRPATRVAVEPRPRPGGRVGPLRASPRRTPRGRTSRTRLVRGDDGRSRTTRTRRRSRPGSGWSTSGASSSSTTPGCRPRCSPATGPAGGGGPVHQRGRAAQAGLRPLRGPLPGRVTAVVHSLRGMTARRLPCPGRRRRRRRDRHPQPARRDEQPRRRDQGGAARRAARQVADDAAVRCVVLTGTGRAFCVGQDLKEHIEILHSGVERRAVPHRRRALQPDRDHARRDGRSR